MMNLLFIHITLIGKVWDYGNRSQMCYISRLELDFELTLALELLVKMLICGIGIEFFFLLGADAIWDVFVQQSLLWIEKSVSSWSIESWMRKRS